MRRLRSLARAALELGVAALIAFAVVVLLVPRPRLLDDVSFSPCYVDRHGQLLRLGLADDDRYRVYVPLEKISPTLIEMTLRHEDRYFHEHGGFNPVSLVRAALFDGQNRRRLGASTITMQLARLHYHLNTRTWAGKIVQIVAAIHLEVHCSKHDILEAYLNLAPYGRNIEGVGAASLIYFQREPADLSPAEAMTLAVIPQSPARRSPGTPVHEAALRQAREVLLGQWLQTHPEDARLRGVLALPLQMSLPRQLPFRAPHLVEEMMAHQAAVPRGETRLTIDLPVQDLLEKQLSAYLAARSTDGFRNGCALLIDYQTMEVRAAVGSADYARADIHGQVNGLRAQRSPGSALKPFIYALALDEGIIQPNTLLRDAPASFDGYDPENFDHSFAGPIHARDALIQSRNVPAVDLESRLSPQRNLYNLLADAGIRHLQPESYYGLTIALGSAEVSPEEIGSLYAMLANRGQWRPLRRALDDPLDPGAPLLSPEASYLTLDMLKDGPRPDAVNVPALVAATRPVAWKTGTSFSYRDAWSAAVFDHDVLVVWIGNFDGTANPLFVGRTAAAPLLFSTIDALRARESAPASTCFTLTPDLNLRQVDLCAVSGAIAGPHCPQVVKGWFIPGKSPIAACDVHREIWVDNDTGLRFSTPPDNSASAHRQVCEFWPSDLAKLFQAAGLARRGPPAFAPGQVLTAHPSLAATPGRGPVIVSPKVGLIYHVRVGVTDGEVLNLEATAGTPRDHLHWFVDSAYIGLSDASSALSWKPQPGRHLIRAVDDAGRADSRLVTVTAVE